MPWVGVGFQTLTCTRPPGPQDHLQFPDVPDVPASAQDLIRQLLCHQEARLGRRGLDDFRNHPFFEGVDWERLATSTAPYIPELRGPMDTSNFDVDDDTLNHPVSGGTHSSSGCGTLPCPAKFSKAVAGLGMGGPWELWFTWAGSPAGAQPQSNMQISPNRAIKRFIKFLLINIMMAFKSACPIWENCT